METQKRIITLMVSLLAIYSLQTILIDNLWAQQCEMATEFVSPVVADEDGEYYISQIFAQTEDDEHAYCLCGDSNKDGVDDCNNFSQSQCSNNNGHWYYGHTGVDWSQPGIADRNDPVLVIANGIVRDTQYTSGWGQKVRIEHQVLNIDGTYFEGYTRYGHGYVDEQGKSSLLVANGDHVSAGQRIMGIGTTGNSSGEHLHYEWQWFYEESYGYEYSDFAALARYEDPEHLREVYTANGSYYPVGFYLNSSTNELIWDTGQVQGKDRTLLFRVAYLELSQSGFDFGLPWNNPAYNYGAYVHKWVYTWVQDFLRDDGYWSQLQLNETIGRVYLVQNKILEEYAHQVNDLGIWLWAPEENERYYYKKDTCQRVTGQKFQGGFIIWDGSQASKEDINNYVTEETLCDPPDENPEEDPTNPDFEAQSYPTSAESPTSDPTPYPTPQPNSSGNLTYEFSYTDLFSELSKDASGRLQPGLVSRAFLEGETAYVLTKLEKVTGFFTLYYYWYIFDSSTGDFHLYTLTNANVDLEETWNTYYASSSLTLPRGEEYQTLWCVSTEILEEIVSENLCFNLGAAVTPTTTTKRPPLSFTDDPIVAKETVIKAVHLTELRDYINTLRSDLNLKSFSWTDDPLIRQVTEVKAVHFQEPRTALEEIYQALSLPPPEWQEEIRKGGVIKAQMFNETRDVLREVW